jgi:hypothetical protein
VLLLVLASIMLEVRVSLVSSYILIKQSDLIFKSGQEFISLISGLHFGSLYITIDLFRKFMCTNGKVCL